MRRVKWLPILAIITGAASVVAGSVGADAAATVPAGLLSIVLAILSRDAG